MQIAGNNGKVCEPAMEIFIMMEACICSVSLAAIATFIAWLVCKVRPSAKKPNHAAVFWGVLNGVFFAYLALERSRSKAKSKKAMRSVLAPFYRVHTSGGAN